MLKLRLMLKLKLKLKQRSKKAIGELSLAFYWPLLQQTLHPSRIGIRNGSDLKGSESESALFVGLAV